MSTRSGTGPSLALPGGPGTAGAQASFDDLGTPLCDVDFVVVDLETTGGSTSDCAITEVGAVRTQGGVVTGEFQTLVNPGVPIPPFIAALTGITTAAVAAAPTIHAVLPMFYDFARGSVLVAHNAPFDIGFLKAAGHQCDLPWPGFAVVDTARLARVLLHRDEVPNNKLATLARHFRAQTTPNHRALQDARATVSVLHGLLERAGDLGAHHLEDLLTLGSRVRPEQRTKRTLADGLPDVPGVYRFLAPDGRSLYVGKAKSIRTRVRQYFTSSETRGRILEMIRIAERVHPIPCTTELEAAVREVRLISAEQPPYNRRSRNAEKTWWVRLTEEPAPRLSLVSALPAGAGLTDGFLGPFASRRAAQRAADTVLLAHELRTCTDRISATKRTPSCIRADIGTCVAPCRDSTALSSYAAVAAAARASIAHDLSPVVRAVRGRLSELAATERFEQAASLRDDLRATLHIADIGSQLAMIGACPQIVAAQPVGREWHIHVIRHGRLAGAARARPDQNPVAVVTAAVAAAEDVPPPVGALTSALAEESRLVLQWLWQSGTRLVRLDGVLAQPRVGSQAVLATLPQVPSTSGRSPSAAPIRRTAGSLAGAAPLRSRLDRPQPVVG